jgi:hypothetical protein
VLWLFTIVAYNRQAILMKVNLKAALDTLRRLLAPSDESQSENLPVSADTTDAIPRKRSGKVVQSRTAFQSPAKIRCVASAARVGPEVPKKAY